MYQLQRAVEKVLRLLAWTVCDGAGCSLFHRVSLKRGHHVCMAFTSVYRRDYLILGEKVLGTWTDLTGASLQNIRAIF